MLLHLWSSHHEAILRPQLVVGDLGLGRQVGRRVVVGGDELGVLVLVQLVGPGLQHALLQLDAPLELHVPERTERHEEAEQPVLRDEGERTELLATATDSTTARPPGGALPVVSPSSSRTAGALLVSGTPPPRSERCGRWRACER